MYYNFGQMDTGPIYEDKKVETVGLGLMIVLLCVALLVITVAMFWMVK